MKRYAKTTVRVLPIALILSVPATYAYLNDPLIPQDKAAVSAPQELITSAHADSQNTKLPEEDTQTRSCSAPTPTSDPQGFEEIFDYANQLMREGKPSEAAAQYKRSIQENNNQPEPYFNLGVALASSDKKEEAVEAFRQAVNRRDTYTKAHLFLARTLCQTKRSDEAQDHFRKVIEQDPTQWEAYAALGRWYVSKENFDDGLPYLRKAAELNQGDVQLCFEYANTLNTLNRLDEAVIEYKKLEARMPQSVPILYNTAYTLKRLNRIDEAMEYYDKVIERDPNHAEAQFSRGLAHIMKGNWIDGWAGYEWRWKRGDTKPAAFRLITQPMWDGVGDLHGKTFLVAAEQGFGDTFQFIRFAREIKKRGAEKVIAYVQNRVKTVCKTLCAPYIDEIVDLQPTLPQFDEWAALPSLPHILGITMDTCPNEVPYLFPDERLVQEWRTKLAHDKNFKVGICWQGNNNYQTPFLRAVVAARPIELRKLAPLGMHGVTIYSLQRMNGTDQLKNLPSDFEVKTFGESFDSANGPFMDTAAVIKNLDLVITVDTSIAHLAGGIGTPTWVLTAQPADWRWLFDREDSPFYPNTRLFRQQDPGDWDPVIERVARELRTLVSFHRSQAKRS